MKYPNIISAKEFFPLLFKKDLEKDEQFKILDFVKCWFCYSELHTMIIQKCDSDIVMEHIKDHFHSWHSRNEGFEFAPDFFTEIAVKLQEYPEFMDRISFDTPVRSILPLDFLKRGIPLTEKMQDQMFKLLSDNGDISNGQPRGLHILSELVEHGLPLSKVLRRGMSNTQEGNEFGTFFPLAYKEKIPGMAREEAIEEIAIETSYKGESSFLSGTIFFAYAAYSGSLYAESTIGEKWRDSIDEFKQYTESEDVDRNLISRNSYKSASTSAWEFRNWLNGIYQLPDHDGKHKEWIDNLLNKITDKFEENCRDHIFRCASFAKELSLFDKDRGTSLMKLVLDQLKKKDLSIIFEKDGDDGMQKRSSLLFDIGEQFPQLFTPDDVSWAKKWISSYPAYSSFSRPIQAGNKDFFQENMSVLGQSFDNLISFKKNNKELPSFWGSNSIH
ncbi:MAG TPA: hypothetical protein VIY47_00045, partial [Ignavibacteriaceae bacterium]